MLLFADQRQFASVEDRYQHCGYCGKDLVVLPDDRRAGACFDCLTFLGRDASPCPDCGEEIPAGQQRAGCVRCGWYPGRHGPLR
jgi:hypothetical protein